MTKIIFYCVLIAFFISLTFPPAPVRSASLDQRETANPVSIIQKIRERGNVLIAGVPYDVKPFGFIDEAGEVTGFDVDLVRALAGLWEVQVQFVPVTAADQVQKLAAGAMDLTTSLAHHWEHAATIDFSQTYFVDSQSVLVHADASIQDMAGLNGKTVAVVRGSTAGDPLGPLATTSGITLTVLPFQEYPAALAALNAGQVDALMAGNSFVRQAAQENPGLAVLALALPPEPYAIGLPKGDAYFRNLLDFSLQFLKTGGVYDQLATQWFPGTTPYALEVLSGSWPYTVATSPTTVILPPVSGIEAIQQRGKLIVGVYYDLPPFGFTNPQGQIDGFDVALAHEFAARWLGDRNAVDLVPVTAATAIPMLAGAAVDMVIAALGHTWERAEQIDFSQTYFRDNQTLLVRVDSGITNLADLDAKRVAAINGSTALDNLRVKATELGVMLDILPFQEIRAGLQALVAGQVDALAADQAVLAHFAQTNPDLAVVGERFATTTYAIGVPKFDGQLRDFVNFTLQSMKRDGTYDAFYGQWLPGASPYSVERWPGELVSPLIRPPTSVAATVRATATPTATAIATRPALGNTLTAPPATSTPTQAPLIATPALTPVLLPTITPPATKALILIPTATPTPTSVAFRTSPLNTSAATTVATPVQTTYIVQANDTLSSIAAQFYDDQLLWPQIYEANINLIGANPNVLVAGTVLVIPDR